MFAEQLVVGRYMSVFNFRQFGRDGLFAQFEIAFRQSLVDMRSRLVGCPRVDGLSQFGAAFAYDP